ncbi:Potassium voltage-gated channel subfamily B member 1, partial [Acropora cervicornis]
MRAPKYLGIVIVAQVSKKSYLCSTVLMLLFIVLRGQATDLDTKCAKGQQISVFWWSHEPYISGSEEYHREEGNDDEIHQKGLWGMFPVILARVLRHCCHVNTTLSYKKTHDEPESLDSILALNQFDVIIPVGAELQALAVRRFPFAVLLESPGVAVLIRGNVSGTQLLLSVLQGWLILVFILISASLAGVVIWLVERKDNYDQFPKTFLRGTFEGFWWVFITMTTVGYGDKAPRTILGKVLGVFWMLAGLIITTMFISIITASLASVSLQGRSDLRGVKVSVVNHSAEHKLGISEIANVK